MPARKTFQFCLRNLFLVLFSVGFSLNANTQSGDSLSEISKFYYDDSTKVALPKTLDITPSNFSEDTQSIITLEYLDGKAQLQN